MLMVNMQANTRSVTADADEEERENYCSRGMCVPMGKEAMRTSS
jgi:hypothetical protein